MAYSNKLCNPTPFPVRIKWAAGRNIDIEPFGEVALQSREQQEDFLPDRPGAEAVRMITDFHGVFLLDPDRDYDVQALDGIKRALSSRRERYTKKRQTEIESRAANGLPTDENTIQARLETIGYGKMKAEMEILEKQAKQLEKVAVESDGPSSQFDPKRTIFVLDPPKEFPSVAAMEFFLDLPGNEKIKERHEAFRAANAPKETSDDKTA